MGVFSEHLCFTGNSVSSEHPPCFHYFGLAQPTTDKQIEERTKRLRSGALLNIYLFLSISFTVIPILPSQRHSSVAAFYKNGKKWKRKGPAMSWQLIQGVPWPSLIELTGFGPTNPHDPLKKGG